MINPFFKTWDLQQLGALLKVKENCDFDDIMDILDGFSKMNVLVIGEPIVDTYVFCQAAGISSKSPAISARALSQENYTGGSLAIANHLAALGCNVSLLITHGDEPYFREMLAKQMNPKIKISYFVTPKNPTPRKTRYLIPFQAHRLFELLDIDENQWKNYDPQPFIDLMHSMAKENEMAIIADFGHGLFEGRALKAINELNTFIALNVQTNSANLGFNPFTKHEKYDYLSIDERECRLAVHDRFTPTQELTEYVIGQRVNKPVSITLGINGSNYFDESKEKHSCPIFFSDVIDTVGAGDAYFTITSLLVKNKVNPDLIPFIGNCFAGLKTRIMGNKEAVDKKNLINLLDAMWKS